MLKYFFPKAIMAGVLIDFGGYVGVVLLYSVAMFIFNSFLQSISFLPVESIFEMLAGSMLINWSMNIICCSIVLFGSFQSGRMARGSEWLNSSIAFGISLGLSLYMGWELSLRDTWILIGIATTFSLAGTYLAVIKNRFEGAEEKV